MEGIQSLEKSQIKTIVILALLVLGYLGYRYYAYEQSLKLPEKDTFVVGLSCVEGAKTGEEVSVDALKNAGKNDYLIQYSNNLYEILVDGKRITPYEQDWSCGERLAHGETGHDVHTFTAGKSGKHKISATTVFQMENSAGKSREYRYHKTAEIQVSAKSG